VELLAMGFNTNWAPVADVNSNPANPIIGDRSFSNHPEKVARHVVVALSAMQDEGIIACAKHFPGHGDTTVDSHLDLPVVEKDPDDLEHLELVPFRAAVNAGVGTVMASHVMFPALDEKFPTTMSPAILRGWLRDKLGYRGVLTSDDMEMKAIADRFPLEQQLDLGSRATIDVFLFCADLDRQVAAYEALVRLQETDVQHDDIARSAVGRLMDLRVRFFTDPRPRPPLSVVGSLDHKMLAKMAELRGVT
jgi:beta-N-acetylhexosaminidase